MLNGAKEPEGTVASAVVTVEQRRMFAGRVAAIDATVPGYGDRWRQWEQRLLAVAGAAVVPPSDPDGHLDLLLTAAADHDAARVVWAPGEPNQCHTNTARLWLAGSTDDGRHQVAGAVTGYALSDDGLWRQHSWAVTGDGRPVETTVARVAYAGVTLAGQTLAEFVAANSGRDLLRWDPAVLRARIFYATDPR
jgi:hypothetical protein